MRQCIAPLEIKEGDLAAYVAGQAPSRVANHVATCPFCQAEAARLLDTELLLDELLYLEDCPEDELMLGYVAGLLSSEDEAAVAAHVGSCPDCAREYRLLTAVSAPETTPAPSLSGRLQALGKQIIQAVQQPGSLKLATSMRGQQDIGQLYEAGNYQIILGSKAIELPQRSHQLQGQIIHTETGLPLAAAVVTLQQQEATVTTIDVNQLGFFQISDIDSGQYSLQIAAETELIIIENLLFQ